MDLYQEVLTQNETVHTVRYNRSSDPLHKNMQNRSLIDNRKAVYFLMR